MNENDLINRYHKMKIDSKIKLIKSKNDLLISINDIFIKQIETLDTQIHVLKEEIQVLKNEIQNFKEELMNLRKNSISSLFIVMILVIGGAILMIILWKYKLLALMLIRTL
jgi:hypothetical protein